MGTTLLAKKANGENPVATDDDHHEALASDPTVTSFPQGSTMADTSTGFGGGFGNASATTSNVSSNGSSTFGSSTTSGFGSSSSFGSSTQSSSFGTSSGGGGFGSSSSSTPAVPQPVLTGAGHNAAEGAEVLVANDNNDWINKKWRPVMGWMYMLVCTCDFVVFPVLWSVLQAISHGSVTSQWQPLTLQGAGLFHLSMGAVLGIAAYGRTKEKVAGAA
jgi:hypothetical protein